MIPFLIDKQDTFEIVRDRIAEIIATESAEQQALAITAGKDPSLWQLAVYTERSNPWDDEGVNDEVIVNVWFESASPDDRASNTVERQTMVGQFNIDVVGFGESRDTLTGHAPGDEAAARAAARGLRLVRNTLMASYYTYLGTDLRGMVGQRWVSNVTSFQPQATGRGLAQSVGARLTLSVRYDEFSPQYPPVQLEYMANQITRAPDGRLLVQVDFDFTQ
ncbi:hypothetical protein D3C77_393970 [compost metagenome]